MNLQYATDRLHAEEQRLADAKSDQEREVASALVEYWQFKVQQYRDGRPSERGEGDES